MSRCWSSGNISVYPHALLIGVFWPLPAPRRSQLICIGRCVQRRLRVYVGFASRNLLLFFLPGPVVGVSGLVYACIPLRSNLREKEKNQLFFSPVYVLLRKNGF